MKIHILTAIICCIALSETHAQPACQTEILYIYTGYDENAQQVLPVSATVSTADFSWIIISDTDPNTSQPRPSYAIKKASTSWKDPMQNTQWITSYPEASNAITGDYAFVYVFCLEPDFTAPYLDLDIRSDNKADLYLNGNFIGTTPTNSSFGDTNPVSISTNNASFFVQGQNELKVVNHNELLVKGINVSGYVSTGNNHVDLAPCCNQTGFISGFKWNDLNGDGIKQSAEPVLSDWEIHLSNSQTAITDKHGYYFFSGLPPGNYTVTEVQQPGWTTTHPASGSYQVVLGPQEVKDGNHFGNHFSPCHERVAVSVDSVCAGKPTFFTASYISQQAPVYSWNFGDGQSGTGTSLSHIYSSPGIYTVTVSASAGSCSAVAVVEVIITDCIPCKECIGSFAPIPGKKYVLSAWVKEANSIGKSTYTGPAIILTFESAFTLTPVTASGLIIDGWQRIEKEFTVPNGSTAVRIKLANTGTNEVFFDDIRIFPFEAGMKSFVYDPQTLRLMAELDERNYATFYEYDEQGALIRVKKETERGTKTIKETGNNTQINH